MLCLLIQLVGVISINVQMDGVSIKSGCVTESQTVHLETMNCPLSAVSISAVAIIAMLSPIAVFC